MPDWLVRALKTFWQAALSYIFADMTVLNTIMEDVQIGKRALVVLIVGAVAAGLSAVYNGVIKPMLESKE